MVRQQLAGLLAAAGVSEIEAHEQRVRPDGPRGGDHGSPSAEHDEGDGLAVVEKGYLLNDTVLRPGPGRRRHRPDDD